MEIKSQTKNHAVKCVKCLEIYESKDEDAYYCSPCLEAKNRVAREVDKRFANRPQEKHMSDLEHYDSLPKVHGFVNAKHFL